MIFGHRQYGWQEQVFRDFTAIFVQWDNDWGGIYDHVAPTYQDYDGTGSAFRFS